MPLFTIDPDKCNRDGICVSECPSRVILKNSPEDVPKPAADHMGVGEGNPPGMRQKTSPP